MTNPRTQQRMVVSPALERSMQLLAVLAGTTTPEAAGQRLGLSPEDTTRLAEAYGLALDSMVRRRLDPTRPRRALAAVVAVLVAAVGLGGGEVLAQVGACGPALPAGLIAFCPDTPALATDVNTNNKRLVDWIQQKVGTVGTDSVSVTGNLQVTGTATTGDLTADDLITPNTLSVAKGATIGGTLGFGATTRQMVNLWQTSFGIGVQDNTLYQRSAQGFAWFVGGTHATTQNDPGAGGSVTMRLGSDGRLTTSFLSLEGTKRTVTGNDGSGFVGYGAGYNDTWADCGQNPVTGVRLRRSTATDQMVVEVLCSF